MNKALTYILVGGASALAGGIAGYFLAVKTMQDRLQKQYEEAVENEIAMLRDRRRSERNNQKEQEESDIENPPPETSDDEDGIHVTDNPYRDAIAQINEKMPPDDGRNHWEDDEEDDDEVYGPESQAQFDMEVYDRSKKPPYRVSLQDYLTYPSEFAFLTWHYYVEDGVLTDEDDAIVDDIDFFIGDALDHFGPEAAAMADGDEDTVYVIHERLNHALEVVRMHEAYHNSH